MKTVDTYRHLDKDSKFVASELSIDEVVDKVMGMNYGLHRFLSSVIRRENDHKHDEALLVGIRELLEKGLS